MEFNILNDTLPIHLAKNLICGPSMSGKTHFVKDLLLNSRTPYEALYIIAHRLDQTRDANLSSKFLSGQLDNFLVLSGQCPDNWTIFEFLVNCLSTK